MSTNISAARSSIQSEIKTLRSTLQHLETILQQLSGGGSDGDNSGASSAGGDGSEQPVVRRRRGRPAKVKKPTGSSADLEKAVEMIREKGKKGYNAIKLSIDMRNAGAAKPSKEALVNDSRLRLAGNGGASTYYYNGN